MSYWIGFRAALLASSAIVAAYANPALAESKTFDVAAQPASSGIAAFAEQADVQILVMEPDTRGRQTQAVRGSMTTADALQTLLAGTGLRVIADNGKTVTLSANPQGAGAGGGAETNVVQELVVTAQKKQENIQVVPIAISAFTQQDLTTRQVTGGPDLMTQVPNMTFTKTNFSSYSIQIRGIGTQAISATVDPAVAVAFNNTPFIRNRFFEQEFYDLERVEVLRGPQGTLYGRNATAGVVNILSAKPTFDYAERLSLDLGNYGSHRVEGMVNMPLVDDKVALRLAGAWTKRDGYDFNQITGDQIDGRDLWSTRLSLRVAPTDKIDVNLIWEHFNEDDDRLRSGKQLCKRNQPDTIAGLKVPWGQTGPGSNNGSLYDQTFSQGCEAASLYSPDSFQVPNGLRLPYYRALSGAGLPIVGFNPDGTAFDPYASTVQSHDLRTIESTVDPIYRAETNTVELQARYNLTDQLTLTSETGYMSDTLFSSQDYNRFNTRPGAFVADPVLVQHHVLDENGTFCDPQIGCANRVVAMDLSTATSSQFSQELRLASNFDGRFNFSVGANFLRYDTIDKYYVFINTLSLYAADRAYFGNNNLVPNYVPGVSDNHQCMKHGFVPPNPNAAQDIVDCVYIDPNPITSLNDLGHNYFLSNNPYKLISYAGFGEIYYNIADDLKLTAGLRWTVDKKEAPRIPSWVLGANTVGYPVAEIIRQEWSEPTGRVTLDWKPHLAFTDQTLVYASFSRGYKAGGANPPASGLVLYAADGKVDFSLVAAQQAAVAPKTFKPEFVNAFEIGSKNTLLDGRLTMNAAAFYYDYQGYQISQIINRAAINLNFDAKIWGLELESDWRPVQNLRLGLKFGYEQTRMADGSQAIDTMDRTAGHKDWFVTAPFPTLPSNCVFPTYIVTRPNGVLGMLGAPGGGLLGSCEEAYVLGNDPITYKPYMPDPAYTGNPWDYPGYKGFDPHTAPNGGAGFYKDLSGHELPNAPHYTGTLTADYTIPMPRNWLATLHTDLYYQSEAWTRVFNTPGYDRLKAYTNVNFAAIFTNEAAGLRVMAYVKNVFDRDSITGAFLNSDDTGLTTNVFLTEPRLFGVRVTKEWDGGGWWTGTGPNHTGPYPLTIEISGQVQHEGADYATLNPALFSGFPAGLDVTSPQHGDLDWGDGREVKLTYRPTGSPWTASASARYGRTNSSVVRKHSQQAGDKVCALPLSGPFGALGNALCNPTGTLYGGPPGQYYDAEALRSPVAWSDGSASSHEQHSVVDFAVGRDVGMGALAASTVSLGVRYAQLKSDTSVTMQGSPSEYVPEGWNFKYTHSVRYEGSIDAHRQFKGAGPLVNWSAAAHLLGDQDTGRLNTDWSIGAGVLFGRQRTNIQGHGQSQYQAARKYDNRIVTHDPQQFDLGQAPRSRSMSVPVLDLSVGLSYDIQRLKLGAGYRWERYFGAIDAGYAERKDYDRTFDGPYVKVSVGFGG